MQKNALSIGCAASLLLWCAAPASAQTPPPMKNLNDTGVSGCVTTVAGAGAALADCSAANAGDAATVLVPRQDARTGRDAAQTIGVLSSKPNNTGAAGFQYTRILLNGTAVASTAPAPTALTAAEWDAIVFGTGTAPPLAGPVAPTGSQLQSWACTRDEVTGLVWSLQNVTANIAGGANNYANATNPAVNGINGYNNLAVCGYNNGWRLPTRRELLSLVNNGIVGVAGTTPMIDTAFFPGTLATAAATCPGGSAAQGCGGYWSRDPNVAAGWVVAFRDGATYAESNASADVAHIRLVRSVTP